MYFSSSEIPGELFPSIIRGKFDQENCFLARANRGGGGPNPVPSVSYTLREEILCRTM